jgi:hypothetical protein
MDIMNWFSLMTPTQGFLLTLLLAAPSLVFALPGGIRRNRR